MEETNVEETKVEGTDGKKKIGKNWIIALAALFVLFLAGIGFLYYRNATRIFDRSEYIKEVIVQNDDFNNLVDQFLDKVSSYNGTAEDTEKVENSAKKVEEFVSKLKEKLGPRVGEESKDHYEKMMAAYDKYVEAINMYKKAVPKNFGDEREQLIYEAQSKLIEAQKDMKSL